MSLLQQLGYQWGYYKTVFVNDWLKPFLEEREGEMTYTTIRALRTFYGNENSTCKFLTPCNPLQVLREISRIVVIKTYHMRDELKSFEEPKDLKDALELVKEAVSALRIKSPCIK